AKGPGRSRSSGHLKFESSTPPRCHRPRRRTIQYSRDISDRAEKPGRTGYPAYAGYDDFMWGSYVRPAVEREKSLARALLSRAGGVGLQRADAFGQGAAALGDGAGGGRAIRGGAVR